MGRPSPSTVLSSVLKKSTDRRGRRSRRGRGSGSQPQLTSSSTSRTAYLETKRWLIEKHGSVCAYCGRGVSESTVTLDHVTPRRGQSAYDRRDNLVLACQPCNGAKADMPILSFLLRKRERATLLVRYGSHLSPMLVELVRDLAGEMGDVPMRVKERFDDLFFEDGESPYHESPYRD
jgi:5-methylcytosine-specific restriction endonuclease McrA